MQNPESVCVGCERMTDGVCWFFGAHEYELITECQWKDRYSEEARIKRKGW